MDSHINHTYSFTHAYPLLKQTAYPSEHKEIRVYFMPQQPNTERRLVDIKT